jgi:multidrug efflux system outer membrane protein
MQPDAGPVPAVLATASAAADGTPVQDAHRVHWRRYFQDPRLQRLIEAALAYNRDLRIAAARVEEARAQWAQVRAERWPQLQFGLQGRLDRVYAEGLSFGPQQRLDMGLNTASFELDFFGRLASMGAAARANFLATEEARRAAELALIGQVAELYHAQRQSEALLDGARALLASRERSLDIVTQAYRAGLAHTLEVEQARLQLAQVQAQLAQWRHLQQQSASMMTLLAGPLPADLPPGLPLDVLEASYAVPLNLSADVLLLRPDIVAAEHRLRGAQASVAAARAAFFPRVSLTASAGLAGSGLANLFQAGAWSFTPSLTLPIFDGGRAKAGMDLARAREAAVVAQYERTVQSAFREVADQLSARESLQAQRLAADRSLAAQQARLTVQRQRHDAGMTGLLEVLDAERELVSAELSQLLIHRAQLDAAVGLYRVLGGGAPPAAGEALAADAAAGPSGARRPAGDRSPNPAAGASGAALENARHGS